MRLLGTSIKEISPLQWSTMLTAFLIPCFRRFVALGIALMIITVIAAAMRQSRRLSIQLNATAWLMLGLFALHFIGLNFSNNIDGGLKEIEIKLSYFVFPLILFFGFEINRRQTMLIAAAFVAGCLLRIPISLTEAWWVYNETGSVKVFSYEMLSAPYHPSYMALYQGVSVLLLLVYFYTQQPHRLRQALLLLVISITLVYISMLASRAGLISAILFIILAALIFWKQSTNGLERIFLSGGCMVVLVASSVLLPGTAQRIEALNVNPTLPQLETNAAAPKTSSMALRTVTWQAAWNQLLEHPFGVGTGNTEAALVDQYKRVNQTKAVEKRLNAHNQWLQMGAEFGWIGLVLSIVLFVAISRAAIQQQQWLMLAIIGVFAFNCLVESMLEVQAGIVFFALLSIMVGPPVKTTVSDEVGI